MKKDIEWLDNEVKKTKEEVYEFGVKGEYNDGYLGAISHFEDLIDKLEESEKPAIPDYVAEWFESNKFKYRNLLHFSTYYVKGEVQASIYNWIISNPNTFVRAWMDGFTIETKKYSVAVDHDNGDWTYASDGRNIFKTRFESDAIQLAKLLGGRVIRYEEGE